MSRILKRAKRWHLVADELKPLPERRDVGRALSYDQKVRLVKTAGTKLEWENARLAMTLALNTTMRGCELKGLRWRDIDLMDRTLTVRRSTTKSDAGVRIIPLNPDAWAAILELWERAKAVAGTDQEHYLLPSCQNGMIDPMRPIKSWRSAWRSLTRAAGLRGLRFHDMRHHAITELSESQTSDQTIMAIAGHVSPRMLAHYSHVRLEAKRKALDALSRQPFGGSYDTKRDTKEPSDPIQLPQLIEKIGGRDRDRTGDPLLAKQVLSQLSYTPPVSLILFTSIPVGRIF